jgi:hypothetical protein
MRDIHPTLFTKLQELTTDYENITAFAKLLPLFADKIITGEFTSTQHFELTQKYKQLPLKWGARWTLYMPTNFPEKEEFHKGLISIYINCMSLFDNSVYNLAQTMLWEETKNIKCYYIDPMNTTFYFKPDEIEAGLESLNSWYVSVQDKSEEYLKQQKRKKLLEQLQELDTE